MCLSKLPRAAILVATVLLAQCWVAAAGPDTPPRQVEPTPYTYDLLRFDEQGVPRDREQFARLKQRFDRQPPAHIFLMAHGWNTSVAEAESSYQQMVALLHAVGTKRGLPPPGGRVAVLGLHWPSLAFEGKQKLIGDIIKQMPEGTAEHLKKAVKYKYGVDDLVDIFKGNGTAQKMDNVLSLVRPFIEARGSTPRQPEPRQPTTLDEKDIETLTDGARMLTFWQMKQRAELVGTTGARALLTDVLRASPKSRVHLIGHSFGCKLWLAALAGEERLPRPVDTLVMLQPAISTQSFAERIVIGGKEYCGGHRCVLTEQRVQGPIVATFTTRDLPLRYSYPPIAQASGHVGEQEVRARTLELSAYRSMGACGVDGVTVSPFRGEGEAYGFQRGLYSLEATNTPAITSHSNFETREVAWMIWAAVQRR